MITVERILIIVALIMVQQSVYAATYYIDAAKGNDAWSGNFPDPVGTPPANGPWQSLAKLAKTSLKPGDTVALHCGRNWTETLKIPTSGTPGSVINITSYPSDCHGSPPTVEGAHPIPAHIWSKHASNTYKANLSRVNLLANSGFETGMAGWHIWSPRSDAELSSAGSCGTPSGNCMKFVSGTGSVDSVAYGNTFSILGGASYQLKFQFKAASGTRVRVILRRNVQPYDAVGVSQIIVGEGKWREISFSFKTTAQIDDARLDFEIGPGGYSAYFDEVRVETQYPTPKAARLGNTPLVPAHHPNRDFDSHEPGSMYVRNAGDSNIVSIENGGQGSTYINRGTDLTLPDGASLQAGLGISVRTNGWLIEDRKIASVSDTIIGLDHPTSYPVKKGWGYFLTGALWMVDTPREWHFEPASETIYLATSSDTPPAETVYITTLDTCIDFSGKRYVRIQNITAQGCVTGVRIEGSTAVELDNVRVRDIKQVGVYAAGAASAKMTRMKIERVGAEAILGAEFSKGIATSLSLTDSVISEAGAIRVNGNLVSLPTLTRGAVIAGPSAHLSRNVIRGTGYHGIRVSENSLVEDNLIEDTCLTLDDCGAIYTSATSGSQIAGNIIKGVHGSEAGKPNGTNSQAKGIYLDDHANSITVANNTVSEADHGIFLHNSFNNVIQGNTVYGNRRNQIWLMEDRKLRHDNGDLYGNQITDNQVFSLVPSAPVSHDTSINDTSQFASYDRNRYSSLISTRVVNESWPTGSLSFRFKEWQAATTPASQPRHQDPNGSVIDATGYTSSKIIGGNIVQNGSLSNGTAGWTPWNETGSSATMQLSSCGAVRCLEFTAGGSPSLIASPPFSVTEDAWYRVTFDIRASSNGNGLSVAARRGGGGDNGYEYLSSSVAVTADQTIKRVSFAFKSSKSIKQADSDTGDIGARLYFDRLLPGRRVDIANLEITPISRSEDSLQTRLLTNPSDESISHDCPDEGTRPELCAGYVDFAKGTPLTWPADIAPRRSRIIYSRDLSMVDTDGDGITDSQDKCADTPAGASANASGCALGQS